METYFMVRAGRESERELLKTQLSFYQNATRKALKHFELRRAWVNFQRVYETGKELNAFADAYDIPDWLLGQRELVILGIERDRRREERINDMALEYSNMKKEFTIHQQLF